MMDYSQVSTAALLTQIEALEDDLAAAERNCDWDTSTLDRRWRGAAAARPGHNGRQARMAARGVGCLSHRQDRRKG